MKNKTTFGEAMKLSLTPLLILISLLMPPKLAHGEVLTDAQIERIILNESPLVEAAQLNAEVAKQQRLAAEGFFDTKLKVKGSNRYDNFYDYRDLESYLEKQFQTQGLRLFAGHHIGVGSIPAYTGKYETSNAGELFAGAALPILRNRSIDENRYRLIEADFNQTIAQFEASVKANETILKALTIAQKWKLAYRKWSARNSLLEIATARQKMLDRQVRLGDVERISLVDAKRSLLKRKADLVEADNELANARAELALYLQTTSGTPVDLRTKQPDLAPEPRVSKESLRVEARDLPQIAALDRGRQLQDNLIEFGRNQRLPALDVQATTYKALPGSEPVDTTRLQVGVYLEVPFENRKGRGLEGEARAKRAILERQRTFLEAEFRTRLEVALNTMEASLSRLNLLKEELESANIVADAERRRWRAGDSSLFFVAAREEEAASVEVRYWQAEFDYRAAILDARFVTARLGPLPKTAGK